MNNSEVVSFAADLVRIPTVLGNEKEAAHAVVQRMDLLGFDDAEIDEVGNAVGLIRGSRPGPTVVFDGHLDTVDVEPIEEWKHDPFGAEIVDGRMYGRGTSDMKGAVAAMIYGVAAIPREDLCGTLVVSASVGEELVEGAALRPVLRRYPADYVVIGEATNLNLAVGGRGRAEFRISTTGKPAHASTPELGINAVHSMCDLIRQIEKLELSKGSPVGEPVWSLTDIISNPYPAHSVVPSGCTVTYERRLVPGETLESVAEELSVAVERANVSGVRSDLAEIEYESYSGWKWIQKKWFPAWSLDMEGLPERGSVEPGELESMGRNQHNSSQDNSHLRHIESLSARAVVDTALAALRAADLRPNTTYYSFCTNAALSAGELGIPTLGLGPSSEAVAHTVDEYVEVDELRQAVQAYAAVGRALAGISPADGS